MADAVAPLESSSLENRLAPLSRDEVLARYRRLREISTRHHTDVLPFISRDTILHHARRLGLAHGNTLVLDDEEEVNYAFDLAIHTAPADRSRAIDRYARSVRLTPGSDEMLMLDAMRMSRFSILRVERRHETAGVITTDLLRDTKGWLVDIGLESSVPDGSLMATRLYTPERFSMASGVTVPLDLETMAHLVAELPPYVRGKPLAAISDDRRFAETVYRVALASGVTERIEYRDAHDVE